MTAREFSHLVPLARLTARPQPWVLEAGAEARAALAARFDLIAIDRLEGRFDLHRTAGGAEAAGRLVAEVVQRCVVSGEPVPARLDEPLALRFERLEEDGAEVELASDMLDVMPVEGDSIDLGEALAQSLAVALDPYPRASDAALAKARRLLMTEEEAEALAAEAKAAASPFAALKRP